MNKQPKNLKKSQEKNKNNELIEKLWNSKENLPIKLSVHKQKKEENFDNFEEQITKSMDFIDYFSFFQHNNLINAQLSILQPGNLSQITRKLPENEKLLDNQKNSPKINQIEEEKNKNLFEIIPKNNDNYHLTFSPNSKKPLPSSKENQKETKKDSSSFDSGENKEMNPLLNNTTSSKNKDINIFDSLHKSQFLNKKNPENKIISIPFQRKLINNGKDNSKISDSSKEQQQINLTKTQPSHKDLISSTFQINTNNTNENRITNSKMQSKNTSNNVSYNKDSWTINSKDENINKIMLANNSNNNNNSNKTRMYNYHMQQNPNFSYLIQQHSPYHNFNTKNEKRDYSNPQTPIKNQNLTTQTKTNQRPKTPPPRNIIQYQRKLMKKEESPFKKEEVQNNKWLYGRVNHNHVKNDYSNTDEDATNVIKVHLNLQNIQKKNKENPAISKKLPPTVLDLTKFKKNAPNNNNYKPQNIIELQKSRLFN